MLWAGACSSFDAAAPNDAGVAETGAPDSGADAPACTHVFCASFDTKAYSEGWSRAVDDLKVLSLDSTRSASAPSSLGVLLSAPAVDRKSFLEARLPASQRIRVSLQLRAERVGMATGSLDVVQLELDPQPEGYTHPLAAVTVDDQGNVAFEVNTPDFTGFPLVAEGEGFRQVEIDADLAQGVITASVGGAMKVKTSMPVVVGKGASLKVGAPYTQTVTNNFRINIDDVIVD